MGNRQKSIRLADVCEVQPGYTARSRLERRQTGGVAVIQLSDLRGLTEFDVASAGLSDVDDAERYRVRSGDILYRSRGDLNTAVLVGSRSEESAIAVLPLMILRPDRKIIDPAYLTWFINQPDTQRYFDKCARGTGLRMIPKACLDDVEVAVPDLATQTRIVEIDALAQREWALSRELADRKLELTSFALLRRVRNAQPHGNGTGHKGARRSSAGLSERTNS